MSTNRNTPPEQDRREFLRKCGKFAQITPPAITLLLSTSLSSDALAKSGGRPTRPKGLHWGKKMRKSRGFWHRRRRKH